MICRTVEFLITELIDKLNTKCKDSTESEHKLTSIVINLILQDQNQSFPTRITFVHDLQLAFANNEVCRWISLDNLRFSHFAQVKT